MYTCTYSCVLTRTLYHAVTKSKLMHKASNAFNSNTAIDCSFSQDILSGNCLITTPTPTPTLNQKYITGWMINRVCETVHVLTTFYLLALSIKGKNKKQNPSWINKVRMHCNLCCVHIIHPISSWFNWPTCKFRRTILNPTHSVSLQSQQQSNKAANMDRLYTKQQHKYLPQTGLVHSHRQLS